jgi:hypothetical protein
MARELGDQEAASIYDALAGRGAQRAEAILWNGEFYQQRLDLASRAPAQPYNQVIDGCLTDQLFGQWLAHTAGLGRFLGQERVVSALCAVYRHNFCRIDEAPANFMRVYAVNDERGVLFASYPKARRKVIPLTAVFRAPEVWTGCEYQVASHMIWEGLLDEGLEIVRAIRERHDGAKRNPWNEPECGDHYARALASYGLLQAYARSQFDLSRGRIAFAPQIHRDRFSVFFAVDGAWGSLEYDGDSASIHLGAGRLEVRELEIDGSDVPLQEPVVVTPDQPLRVGLGVPS